MYFKENIEANWASSFKIQAKIKKQAILGASHLADEHRRTGNFLPGGAVNRLPKKISQVAQIFLKESKRNEGHIATT